ncbi:MAG TPA: penicillin acylase family protein [Bryobacteraceae bacterium]|nr:penicillin acylase family protein [Bryobacteraceae bacterium]
MKYHHISALLLIAATCFCASPDTVANDDKARWDKEAQSVTIVRDDWGIAHIHGKTDADAVFGMIYAQAEDDFNRVETNYLNSLGRLAEAEGESKIYQDLRQRLFVDPAELKSEYAASPVWLQSLMNAWADGLNYYLLKHAEVTPRVIHHFESWMALSFTEGSIGGDIEQVKLAPLAEFYGKSPAPAEALAQDRRPPEPSGSNGIAIAPSNTINRHALLLINPHTDFFFRSELQMTSDEGLNAYGAATWGQFFLYQGFNDRVGWMHTTSRNDSVDEYLETISKKNGALVYKYGSEELPVITNTIVLAYKTDHGLAQKTFTVYRTQHGPIVREENGKWISVRMMHKPIESLTQSYIRTKAHDYKSYRQTMELHANSSNNTVYADADGNIAYFHSNFIPRRDTHFDWEKPVDGSDPATDWHGVMSVEETPHLLNPPNGWIYNSNNWPWSAAGPYSPKRSDFPAYVDTNTAESPRGLHALRVLTDRKDFTVDSLMAAAYDSYLPWFQKTLPILISAWERSSKDPKLAEQMQLLSSWDYRWGVNSVATSLAVFWGDDVQRKLRSDARRSGLLVEDYVAAGKAAPDQLLQSLAAAGDRITKDFGRWNTPWGEINRFQRLDDSIAPHFNDADSSIPVGFTSSQWGSLASFGAHAYPNTKKWYGSSGNSFVAVVEFGDRIHARAVTAGGESGHPQSPHFDDEAQRYATGNLRDVYFYPSDLKGHIQRQYHPGS